MRRALLVVALGCCLLASRAPAVFEDVSSPSENVSLRVDGESRAAAPESLLQKEEERQAAARERAERIRRLPPDRVQAWVEGKVSEEELQRISLAAPVEAESENSAIAVEIPRGRMLKLAVCGGLVVALAGMLWRRRRQDQIVAAAGKKRVA